MTLQENTPIESHIIEDKAFDVKREDLYSLLPAPSLAKLRGIKSVVARLAKEGYTSIGVMDTRISKAGWGLAYLIKNYFSSLKAICYYPKLKSQLVLPEIQQNEENLGALVIPLVAGRVNICYSKAKKHLASYPNSFMLPMGLVLPETSNAVAEIIKNNPAVYEKYKTIIVSLGTGTICSGIIKGFSGFINQPRIIGVSCGMAVNKISNRIKKLLNLKELPKNVELVKPYCDYYFQEEINTPFPSSNYYDKKALKYLLESYNNLSKPILFWNIGT